MAFCEHILFCFLGGSRRQRQSKQRSYDDGSFFFSLKTDELNIITNCQNFIIKPKVDLLKKNRYSFSDWSPSLSSPCCLSPLSLLRPIHLLVCITLFLLPLSFPLYPLPFIHPSLSHLPFLNPFLSYSLSTLYVARIAQ